MSRLMRLSALSAVAALGLSLAGTAQAGMSTFTQVVETRCAPGSYSVVTSPDGASVSILFDDLALRGAPARTQVTYRASCHVEAPLHLPAGYSLGLYRVDYRGFAHLDRGQTATVSADYNLNQLFRRSFSGNVLSGPRDGGFGFTEVIQPGQMKRVGCDGNAVLDLTMRMELPTVRAGAPMVTLDSVDGGPAVTYRFELRKC